MGIQGLLQLLKPITEKKNIVDLKGKTAGVDAFAWLHRASYGCALQVCKGLKTSKYVDWCIKNVKLLAECGIQVIIVFDGDQLPMKKEEEQKRASIRRKNFEEAEELWKIGNKEAAYKKYQAACKVTRPMVRNLVLALQLQGVPFVVAPYEADAQLGYLYRKKKIDFVISEDSDLLLFGCEKVMYKMDYDTGYGDYIDLSKLKTVKTKDRWCKVTICSFPNQQQASETFSVKFLLTPSQFNVHVP